MSAPLRLAFAHFGGPDARLESHGPETPFALLRALRARGVDVVPLGPLDTEVSDRDWRQLARYARAGQHYALERSATAVAGYARQVERGVREHRPDAVLSLTPLAVAALDVDVPIVLWTDVTAALRQEAVRARAGMSAESVARGWQIEADALTRVRLALYTTAWAARSAHEDLDVPLVRLGVLPYGPRLDAPPDRQDVLDALRRRELRPLRLLWIGDHWRRQGGDVAISTLRALRRDGVPATLTLACTGPTDDFLRQLDDVGVRVESGIRASTFAGRARLNALLRDTHALLLPTDVPHAPVLVADANAFAVPVFAARIGGVAGVVRDGVTGVLVPPRSNGATFAARLAQWCREPEGLLGLARHARDHFEEALDWTAVTRRLTDRLDALLERPGPAGRAEETAEPRAFDRPDAAPPVPPR